MKGKHVFNIQLLLFSHPAGRMRCECQTDTVYVDWLTIFGVVLPCNNSPGFSSTHVFFVCCCVHVSFSRLNPEWQVKVNSLSQVSLPTVVYLLRNSKVCNSITQMILFIAISRTLTYQVWRLSTAETNWQHYAKCKALFFYARYLKRFLIQVRNRFMIPPECMLKVIHTTRPQELNSPGNECTNERYGMWLERMGVKMLNSVPFVSPVVCTCNS